MNTTKAEATHTPGPFNIWPEHSTGKWIVSRTVPGTGNEETFAECWTEANARLIAAAPELLEALRKLESRCAYAQQHIAAQAAELEARGDELAEGHRRFANEYLAEVEQARAAIAKATGA